MNRADLQRLSRIRLQEARSLLNLKQYSGAYYLAGYAAECALKACIAKQTLRFDFPDKDRVLKSYTHSLRELISVANLAGDFQLARQLNPKLQASWEIVSDWSEHSRYAIWTKADAGAMIDAVGRLQDGVAKWITLHW